MADDGVAQDEGKERLAQLEAENARLREELGRLGGGAQSALAWFRSIADSIDQMIWTARPDGHHDYYNRRWYEYTDMPEGSTDGEEWNGMFHPDDQERAWALWWRSLETGEPYRIEYRLRHRSGEYRWVLGRAQPVRDEDGEIVRWYGTCTDIHDLKLVQERLEQSEARLNRALEVGRIGDYDWNLATGALRWSHNLMRLVGLDPSTEVNGERIFELIHPDDRGAAQAALQQAIETGAEIDVSYRVIGDDGVTRWIASRGQVEPDPGGEGLHVVGVNYDVTSLYEAEAALRESEERLRIVQAAGGIGSFDYDLKADEAICSPEYYELLGLPQGYPINRETWSRVIHPDDSAKAVEVLDRAIAERKPFDFEYRIIRADTGETRWLTGRAAVVFDRTGEPRRYVGGNIDVTERKRVEEALQTTSQRLNSILNNTRMAVFLMDEHQQCLFMNNAAEELTGFAFEETQGRALHDVIHHKYPDGSHYPLEECPIDRALPEDDQIEGEELFVHKDGHFYPVRFTASPIRDEDGRPIGTIIEARNIAEEQEKEAALREQGRTLETLNRTGAAVAAELDLQKLVQMVTDAGVELTGARFGAFFYNVENDAGESFMLYALSGADPSQFGFGMPRATAVFHPTFAGEGVVRSDDITKDSRYGLSDPHFGMPKGHLPVTSYLAVSVTGRSGEVIGGLFFGHEEPGRFTDRHEQLMTGIAAQAAIGIDNARLFQAAQKEVAERMRAEAELRLLNETLEQRVAEEVAQRAQAEEALRQAQKMETLGQLTGGVAHDFNNLLQIVSGNLDLLLRNLPEDSARLRRAAENAQKGAERAAVLTQRLLAFSRRQPLEPKPIDVNRLIGGMSELLHRALGEMTEVETVLASGLWPVEADPNQLENAILNLAVNARDAMPQGGKLTIETANTHLDHGYTAQHAGVAPGQYVSICVSDTGIGMSADMLDRAFEPFFTTKDVGKGTGLGLSMVYGYVKQSGGHVKIYSEPGEGTSVKLYLPRLHGTLAAEEEAVDEPVPEGTREETILVCEDDDDVRTYSVEVLRELGYRVLEAHDGPSALRLLERQEGRVDLLFTDVVLPSGMTGADLAAEARKLRPELKVLFTTGYARNAIVHQGRLDPGVELITKPFSYADLAARVRDLLDSRGS